MLNSNRLIYILPDVSYIAELLPGKKEHTFSVQAFRQVNGEFMADENIKPENISKLFSKLEKEEYHLILPDFLFTNTIVNVPETSETKIKAHITEKLLPSLSINDKSHLITFFTLTTRKGVSSVQISAIEHESLEPIKAAAKEAGATITAVSPVTWTMKSVISLEPSVSVLQLGAHIFVAKHYIGVDQTSFYPADDTDDVVQAITALKGAEPSIQTVYVLSNELIETKLKEGLSQIIPIQQIAPHASSDSELPAHVQEIIEQSMKTLDIVDFPVPRFTLEKIADAAIKPADTQKEEVLTMKDTKTVADTDITEEKPKVEEDKVEKEEKKAIVVEAEEVDEDDDHTETADTLLSEPDVEEPVAPEKSEESPAITPVPLVVPAATAASAATDLPKPVTIGLPEISEEPKIEVAKVVEPIEQDTTEKDDDLLSDVPVKPEPETSAATQATLEKFVAHNQNANSVVSSTSETMSTPLINPEQKEVIKNPSTAGTMVKMVFITISVLFLTVAVGVGLGLGFLNWQQQSNSQVVTPVNPSPSPIVEITPSPTPVASASSTVDKTKVKLLIVNATTIAGKAGVVKKSLEADGFTQVTAGNAKGTYKEKGTLILMTEEDAALVTEIGTATKLNTSYAEGITVEDPKGAYTAVVVINE